MRIIVGITGASGSAIGKRMLEELKARGVETHLVISPAGRLTAGHEIGGSKELEGLATKVYGVDDIGAAIASGSFSADGMAIAPCSMKTLSAIANGYEEGLIVRAAGVCLKQKRPLVLIPREAPLLESYAENMAKCMRMGAVVLPPMVPYYIKPESVSEITDFFVGRALEFFGIDANLYKRWDGL